MNQLRLNKEKFDRLLTVTRSYYQKGAWPELLDWARLTAASGWHAHTGQYVSEELEIMLVEASQHLDKCTIPLKWELPSSFNDNRRILHVLTAAYVTGGHTRLVEKWLKYAKPGERHAYVLIDQDAPEIPEWLPQAAHQAGGAQFIFPASLSRWQKARLLRDMAVNWADIVVLHTHPDDPVATVALGIPEIPPVLLQNHSGHSFWLGSMIADHVIDYREPEYNLSLFRRHVKASSLVPLPIQRIEQTFSKQEARRILNLPEETVVLLAIGSSYKYAPWGEHHFPNVMRDIILDHPNAVLLVVGPSAQESVWSDVIKETKGRIIVYGLQKEIDMFYATADIYLESFPVGSLTAALEAALRGLPVIPGAKPLAPIYTLQSYQGMDVPSSSFEEYKERVGEYIRDGKLRRQNGITLKKSIEQEHGEEVWRSRIDRILDQVSSHSVGMQNREKTFSYGHDEFWSGHQLSSGTFSLLHRTLNQQLLIYSKEDNLNIGIHSIG